MCTGMTRPKTSTSILAGLLGLAAAGCGDHGGPRLIKGKITETAYGTTGTILRNHHPRDLSQVSIAALVADGKGGYRTVPGVGYAEGTFQIAAVPSGSFLLQMGSVSVETDGNSVVELDAPRFGPPDRAIAPAGAALSVTAAGMTPWSELGDYLYANCYDAADAWGVGAVTNEDGTSSPATGDTALTNLKLTADDSAYRPMHALLPGDHCLLLHEALVATPDGNGTWGAPTEVADLAVGAPDPNNVNPGTGTFKALPQSDHGTVDFHASEFAALYPDAAKEHAFPSSGVSVAVQPNDPHEASMGGLFAALDVYAGSKDLAAFPVSYANPFPSWWTTGLASFYYNAQPKRDDAQVPARFYVGYYAGYLDPQAVVGKPVHVELSTVQAPTVNGADLLAPQKGLGLTPTLAWKEPALGQATHYEVAVIHLGLDAATSTTTREHKQTFLVRGTSLTLPPGLLEAGEPYVINIAAVHDDGGDLALQLVTSPTAQVRADRLSAVLVP
jgi:hypothetical protein